MQEANARKRIRVSGEAAAWLVFWILALASPTPINLLNPWGFIFAFLLGLPVAIIYSMTKLRYLASQRTQSGTLIRPSLKQRATEIVSILALMGAWFVVSWHHLLQNLFILALILAATRMGFFRADTERA